MTRTVWYISKYASPLKYGFGSRHFSLAREFNKLGYQTLVLASDANHLAQIPRFPGVYTRETVDGIDTCWIRTAKYKRIESLRRILSWVDFEAKLLLMPKGRLPKPDVVIASSLSLLSVLSGAWLKWRTGAKLLIEVRDIWPLTIVEEGGFSPRNPAVKVLGWLERFGYRRADIVVGTMPNLADHVDNVCGEGIDTRCVPFGYDPELFDNPQPLPDGYVEALDIPVGKFVVGYAGSIGTTNALETLIDCAFAMEDHPRVHFLLLGAGDKLEEYKQRTAELGNVTFATRVAREQVHGVLALADMLYFSVKRSKVWDYGMSLNKLIDYMMSAKPIVGSYSGFPSMINEADCGVFVPADDVPALVEAVEEYAALPAADLAAIGQRGKDWLIANRPYDRVAEQYTELF